MNITKSYSFVAKLIVDSNLRETKNNLYIQNAYLHNSEGLIPVDKISDLWGNYLKIDKVKGYLYNNNTLMFRIYAELEDYFSYDTIYLTNRDDKILFAIKFDELITQKVITQEGILTITQDMRVL